MMARTKLRCAGDSHMGMVRRNNEDRFHVDPDRGIFMVVDGIGGQAAGEHAAEIAVSRVRTRLERQTGSAEDRVREAIAMANNEVLRQAEAHSEWRGMACVLTVALVEDGHAVIGHVGDSRLYKIHQGEIRKITHDHSPVGESEDTGQVSEAEAMRHPRRNEVYRDVGSQEHAPDDPDFIEVARIPFEPDSALLLCSDGLSDQVTSAAILNSVQANAGNPAAAVEQLIAAANQAGGKDNVTVLVVEGEQFADTRGTVAAAPPAHASYFAGRLAFFVYGCACAALIFAGYQYYTRLNRPPEVPPPRTLHVGVGGYIRIGEALAHARPGDTVEVSAGEYPERLRLKDGVTVRGREPEVPVLRADPLAPGAAVAVVAEGVHGARLSGFRIRADEQAPLAAAVTIADADLHLEDTEIIGAATGVEIRGKSESVLRANSIQDCKEAAVRVTGDAAPRILFNVILHNGRGLVVESPARAVLQGNTFRDDGAEPVLLPEGADRAALLKFNFFLPPTPPARRHGGTR
ncbi:MAG TPA: protein phosphatase 2C domain-containing protein [Bryobacteraceae bacterium]|nr:protein phosphatase 2C domain-containing protein [Bryobacteraceae bacterium]